MDNAIFHSFDADASTKIFTPIIMLCLFVFIFLGIGTGYFLAQTRTQQVVQSSTSVGTMYGSDDTTTFKDTAEGQLAVGGVQDEGQYHLVRSGGNSQNVYLTSSLVDLSKFTGRTVKVWGQT